jgi:hypothetical protein
MTNHVMRLDTTPICMWYHHQQGRHLWCNKNIIANGYNQRLYGCNHLTRHMMNAHMTLSTMHMFTTIQRLYTYIHASTTNRIQLSMYKIHHQQSTFSIFNINNIDDFITIKSSSRGNTFRESRHIRNLTKTKQTYTIASTKHMHYSHMFIVA